MEDYKPFRTKAECMTALRIHNRESGGCDVCPYRDYEVHGVGLFGVDELGDCMVPLLKDAEYYLRKG